MKQLELSKMPDTPWQNLSMDVCGPLPTGVYLLVIIDEHSRYPVVEVVRSVSANTVTPVVDTVLSMFGRPYSIKTDNDSPFNSVVFEKYAENSGFAHRGITPQWPRAHAFNKPLMKARIETTIMSLRGYFTDIRAWTSSGVLL